MNQSEPTEISRRRMIAMAGAALFAHPLLALMAHGFHKPMAPGQKY
jgi:hypothetical protein